MESKLNLNRNLVDKARESARRIAEDTQNFIDLHTTVTVERAVCRLLGIDGVNALEVPLPNVVVDHLFDKGLIICLSAACSPAAQPIISATQWPKPA